MEDNGNVMYDPNFGVVRVSNDDAKIAYVNECRKKWSQFKDRLRQFSAFSDEIMDECTDYNIWRQLMIEARKAGVTLRTTKKMRKNITDTEKKAAIKPLSDYSHNELKSLYKSLSLYTVTEWFKHIKRYRNDVNVRLLCVDERPYNDETDKRFFNRLKIRTIEEKIDSGSFRSENEKYLLMVEKTTLEICNEVIFWCGGGIEALEQNYKEGKNVIDPNELREELHMADDLAQNNGRATLLEVYQFIWNTLRFCDVSELCELTKLADKKFIVNPNHRPKNNKKIYKYDKDGNLVAEYNNRNDCMKYEKVSKQALYNVVSGRREYLKGFKYVEK